jgi:PAT family beta-lactamase induction signal transducer AmpG
MQLLISVALLGVALTLPTSIFFMTSLACFWMAAFASATNDIASDGYYMIGLTEKKQSFFVGMRSTFYRLAMVTGQGLIVILAGFLENYYGDNTKAWSITMTCTAFLMLLLTLSNFFVTPKFETSSAIQQDKPAGFFEVFSSFFKKPHLGIALAFILCSRRWIGLFHRSRGNHLWNGRCDHAFFWRDIGWNIDFSRWFKKMDATHGSFIEYT